MNFEFFAFLVFMSFSSFAMAFLAYAMVVRFMGRTGWLAKAGQMLLVPACILIFDFITIAVPIQYRYYVGSLPLVAVAVIFFYMRFFKGESLLEDSKPAPMEAAGAAREEKKFSKKSQRIHAARQKRGRD